MARQNDEATDMAHEPHDSLIGGRYAPAPGQLAPFLAPSLRAVVAADRQGEYPALVALRVAAEAPARATPIAALPTLTIPGLLRPLGFGVAGGTAWVVCNAPPGPALSIDARWPEQQLFNDLLRPAATALDALMRNGLTHRAIRPDNVFRDPSGTAVLGPAWAEPPASLQPAVFEPPYSQVCLRSGRGDGSIADDVYALGVLMLSLWLGRLPLAGIDDADLLARKIERGSYDALVEREPVPAALAELLRGMLSEDPQHRPAPGLLRDPAATMVRRSVVQMPRPSERSIVVGPMQVWTGRGLALALALHPVPAAELLRKGTVLSWLRRSLADAALAGRVETSLAGLSAAERMIEPMGVMRAVAALDPLAPLCWRGLSLWPDGMGPALVETRPDRPVSAALEELVSSEAVVTWAAARPGRIDTNRIRAETRVRRMLLKTSPPGAGVARLAYALNPLLACVSPLLGSQVVTRLPELLTVIEALAPRAERGSLPLDGEMLAFIAARDAQRPDIVGVVGNPMRQLQLLAQLQARLQAGLLPATAGWLAQGGVQDLSAWQNRATRDALASQVASLVAHGSLLPLAKLLADETALCVDRSGAQAARAEVARIDTQLRALALRRAGRLESAQRTGSDVVGSFGLMLAAGALAVALMS